MSSQKCAFLETEGKWKITEYGALLLAAEIGDVGTVKRLLSKNIKANAKMWKRTEELLQVAARKGHVEVVKVFLNLRANFNKASRFLNNSTPLHLAALEGHAEVLSVLLSRGADVDAKNKFGRTPLHLTTRYNKPECAKLLLDFKAKVNVSDLYNFTPLHLAARNGCVEIVRMLLNMGADVKAVDKRARATPLHLAAANGHVEIVKLLLNQEACLDIKDVCHKTALYYAIDNDNIETAEVLFNHQNMNINELSDRQSRNLLLNKSLYGRVKTIRFLLSKGADVNVSDLHNRTPLFYAANRPRAVKVLLSAGASVDAVDDSAYTPLHFAAVWSSKAVVQLLLGAGADANARGHMGSTALHLAAEWGCTAVVKLLLNAGAEVNAAGRWANTPLHVAAGEFGSPAAVNLLLRAGADVNATNIRHQTPLQLAGQNCEKVLKQHVVKRMALSSFVNESNTLAIRSDDGMVPFRLKCDEEIELMKSQKIENGVSFFDILTKTARQLVSYARNKDIVRVFKSNVYLSAFPLYASEIKNSFVPAIKRAKLLESGHKFFDMFLSGLPRLEYLFSEEILMHLSNSDLKLLRDFVKSEK